MYLLIDIGGTKARIGTADSYDKLENISVFKTPKNFEEGIEEIKKGAEKILEGEKPEKTVVGFAGPIERNSGEIVYSPNLPEWVGKGLLKKLSAEFGNNTYLENDVALGALGEALFGAGKGARRVFYMTVSTGANGAFVENGQTVSGKFNTEMGQQIIDLDSGKKAGGEWSGSRLKDLISGSAIERQFGKEPYKIKEAEFWDEKARLLAYGLHNVVVSWAPDIVVLGGAMIDGSKGPVINVEKVRKYLKNTLYIYPEIPEIEKAELGDEIVLWGGLAYLKNISDN